MLRVVRETTFQTTLPTCLEPSATLSTARRRTSPPGGAAPERWSSAEEGYQWRRRTLLLSRSGDPLRRLRLSSTRACPTESRPRPFKERRLQPARGTARPLAGRGSPSHSSDASRPPPPPAVAVTLKMAAESKTLSNFPARVRTAPFNPFFLLSPSLFPPPPHLPKEFTRFSGARRRVRPPRLSFSPGISGQVSRPLPATHSPATPHPLPQAFGPNGCAELPTKNKEAFNRRPTNKLRS